MGEPVPKTQRRTEKVWFNETEVTVKEISLRQFQQLGDIISEVKDLAQVFQEIEKKEAGEIVEAIVGLLHTAPESLGKIISKATDMDPDAVLDGTLNEVMDLVTSIIRVNNVAENFKKKVASLLPSA